MFFLSDPSVVFGHGGADHFIRGIFHSAGCVSSHASHQLQGPCVRNDCLRSPLVGQKHETASSSSFITVFKFIPLQWRPDPDNFGCLYLQKIKCVFIVTGQPFIFKGMLCCWTVCPTPSSLVYETSGGVTAVFSASCFRDTLSGTQCSNTLLR